jgi:hypothetical protein
MTAYKSRLTYDDVIATLPTLAPDEQLNVLEVLSSLLKKAMQPKTKQHSLLELEGLGVAVWAKVNVGEYIRQERDSWS